jgi:maltooligosyltrehalose trehalohydrolase
VTVIVERLGQRLAERECAPDEAGYTVAFVPDALPGDRYWIAVDGNQLADPASRFQPQGPFGPSEVVDPATFTWSDGAWRGVRLEGQILYEMHCGTFTPEGTWRAAMERLPYLAELGVTAIETMPVGEFPGRFGWGYDAVFLFAPSHLYGSPDDFRAFVDRAHQLGLAVILDVVYNHFGPDGAVFRRFASDYFTTVYDNQWGEALNFDGVRSNGLRDYVVANAQHWIAEYHLDGLRLDATQAIHDRSSEHIVARIAGCARAAAGGRPILLFAENERQQAHFVRPHDQGGYGLDALWNDDFHHTAVVALTGRAEAYFSDHRGTPQELISAVKYGYLFQGQRNAWQKHPWGTSTRDLPPGTFVNYLDNHDQVANSANGARIQARTSPGRFRAMTALLLLAPGTPLLFQGQEWTASPPFLFFADHRRELALAVQRGRADFLAQFSSLASAEAKARLPPPHAESTFEQSKLRWRDDETQTSSYRLHRDLIRIRRTRMAFRQQIINGVDGAVLAPEAFALRYVTKDEVDARLLLINLGPDVHAPSLAEPLLAPPDGYRWSLEWSSDHPDYGGGGVVSPISADGSWQISGHAAVVLAPERGDSLDAAT